MQTGTVTSCLQNLHGQHEQQEKTTRREIKLKCTLEWFSHLACGCPSSLPRHIHTQTWAKHQHRVKRLGRSLCWRPICYGLQSTLIANEKAQVCSRMSDKHRWTASCPESLHCPALPARRSPPLALEHRTASGSQWGTWGAGSEQSSPAGVSARDRELLDRRAASPSPVTPTGTKTPRRTPGSSLLTWHAAPSQAIPE